MAYTTIDKPSDYFNTKLYAGNSGTQSITGVGFQPDWVWIKSRNYDNAHHVFDVVRGVQKRLLTSGTQAEATMTDGLSAFGADGFTLGSNEAVNGAYNYASWNWKAGTSFTNDASSTGIGTIDSAGSFNNDSGFSIVSYTGTGSAGTIKHGLNSTPSTIILKNRIDGSVFWYVYHKSLGNNSELYLNGTDAAPSSTGAWNTTSPTSSVFSVGSHGGTNASGQATIAYCFADTGNKFFKAGSYTGNGSDTQFIYTGFAPAFVMWKNTNESDNHWCIIHNKAETFNGTYGRTSLLRPNDSGAEIDGVSNTRGIDFLSNGFCLKSWGGSTGTITANESGDKYIFMCFAESPFTTSTGVPTTAR